jgi:hypothetical protein
MERQINIRGYIVLYSLGYIIDIANILIMIGDRASMIVTHHISSIMAPVHL